ncbi:MAG TPA: HD domain-containing protein [Chryseolinea sp.]|nr:HD domain-containing protein [Chryseolinea sp.]
MEYARLLTEVREHVTTLFQTNDNKVLLYHNLAHTLEVGKRSNEIGQYYSLSAGQFFILTTAALFHDVGYLFTRPIHHEEEGMRRMTEYLVEKDVPGRVVLQIAQAILATKRSVEPLTMIDKIICDADTYHFGTSDFKRTDALVKRELELQTDSTFPNWAQRSIVMLKKHTYYTAYCQARLNNGKEENIAWLTSLL